MNNQRFYPYPRRFMRGNGEFFPPRYPPQQFRKMRPHWGNRMPRPPSIPPHYPPPPPPESFMPYPPPVWPIAPPPPPPKMQTPVAQNEPDTRHTGPYRGNRMYPPQPHPYFQQPTTHPVTKTEPDTTLSETTHAKRRKKSSLPLTAKPWDKEAAQRAHDVEMEWQKCANAKSVVIRFPDPELSKEIVQAFHPMIDNVHFQGPCGVRYCFVTLKEDANVDKVMDDINKVKFGVGTLNSEKKAQRANENSGYENIDPFTLYVGNLSLNVSVNEVKERFPTSTRVDIGHAKRMKNTRYAFVKYNTAEAALEAYKTAVNSIINTRSIIVRFRRHKATFGPPGEDSSFINEIKPKEKLTVGAKLKAKKEKARLEKIAKDSADKKKCKLEKKQDSDDDIEMENDDDSLTDGDDFEDDDDDDDVMHNVRESESDEDYEMSGDEEVDADDDDDDDDITANLQVEDDNYFEDEDEVKDVS